MSELEKEQAEQVASEKEVIGYARRRPRSGEAIARLPEDIETETREIVPQEVLDEPDAYERIGESRTRELDVIPMRFVVRETVRPKFKRKGELDAVPFLAALPLRLVPGGIPAAGLVAQVIVWKFADHMPLYRLERIFLERFGVRIPRQRMCDWIAYTVENWLSIIYQSIRSGLISGDYLQIDETPVRYLDTDRKGKSHKGYFWVFGRPEDDVCFDWRLGRGKEGAESIVSEFQGLLQSDGYVVYDKACEGLEITQLGCWAHARRRFYDAWKNGEAEAVRYLLHIRNLYEIERDLPEDPGLRMLARQEKSKPVLLELEKLLEAEADRYLAKSGMADAVGYARNQWGKLVAYVEHGQTRIDNNLTEQAIRPCKLGAKNWLFVGSPAAGKTSAVIYCYLRNRRERGFTCAVHAQAALIKRLSRSSKPHGGRLSIRLHGENGTEHEYSRLYGWAYSSKRYVAQVPHGHWKSSTVLGALRKRLITVLRQVDTTMNVDSFLAYLTAQLFPISTPSKWLFRIRRLS